MNGRTDKLIEGPLTAGARVAVELSAPAARALVDTILAVLAEAQRRGLAERLQIAGSRSAATGRSKRAIRPPA